MSGDEQRVKRKRCGFVSESAQKQAPSVFDYAHPSMADMDDGEDRTDEMIARLLADEVPGKYSKEWLLKVAQLVTMLQCVFEGDELEEQDVVDFTNLATEINK
jgi:hypothetical protein